MRAARTDEAIAPLLGLGWLADLRSRRGARRNGYVSCAQ
jgi:hypothetical protein